MNILLSCTLYMVNCMKYELYLTKAVLENKRIKDSMTLGITKANYENVVLLTLKWKKYFSLLFSHPLSSSLSISFSLFFCFLTYSTKDVQGQRSPRKMVGARAVAAWCSSSCEETPHVQGQRRSPSKTVGGVNLWLESNPIPARDAQRAQTNLVDPETQRPHRDWERTVFEHLLWRYGSAVDCCRGRGSGFSRLGYGISPLGGGCH